MKGEDFFLGQTDFPLHLIAEPWRRISPNVVHGSEEIPSCVAPRHLRYLNPSSVGEMVNAGKIVSSLFAFGLVGRLRGLRRNESDSDIYPHRRGMGWRGS
jgi:hypothetical protein